MLAPVVPLTMTAAEATEAIIPPGFIDFASHSFDAIFYQRSQIQPDNDYRHSNISNATTIPSEVGVSPASAVSRRRASHLPDLLPFMQLVTEKCHVHPVLLVMALIYVQRFRACFPPGYKAEPQAAHRIFAASLLVASKYLEDKPLSTKQLVRSTGDVWSIKEMTRMELAFLQFLHWNLYIDATEMTKFLGDLNFKAELIFG